MVQIDAQSKFDISAIPSATEMKAALGLTDAIRATC